MKILVHHRIASRDGQSVHLEELTEALRREGHTILVVGPNSFKKVVFGASINSIDYIKRLAPKPLFEIMEIAYNVIAYRRLRRAMRQFQPDFIYERFSLFLFCGIWASRSFRVRILLEVNSPLFEERLATNALSLKNVGRWSQRWIFRRSDAILPVTEVLAQVISNYGIDENKLFVIPNGVNSEYFKDVTSPSSARASLRLPDVLTIGFVGFVREWNSVHRLVRFASLYRERSDLHILIVGDGPARASIEDYAKEVGLKDKVTITGVIARSDVARWLNAMDIAVLPSVTWYSSPLKLFEYMELKKAIIAPDLPNIQEILTNGVNALLFGDQEGEMERVLERLCESKELREKLGQNAHETIRKRQLTWEGNARRIAEIAGAICFGKS